MFTAPAHGTGEFDTHFVSASLRPEAVTRIFGIDADAVSRSVIDAEDVFGSDVRSLRDRVGESGGTASRFAALIGFLREQRRQRSRPAPFAAVWAMSKTLATHGSLSVDDLCGELGVSRKHLNKTYRTATGLSPKTFARLTRFRSVIDRLQCPDSDAWATIALDRGYFDQAHLIRDFRQFAGETPTAFMQHRSPDGESVNFNEQPEADPDR